MNTKEKLYKLFDYQKFENNPELQDVVDSVLDNSGYELSDEVLLAATGGITNEKITPGNVIIIDVGQYASKEAKVIETNMVNVLLEIDVDGKKEYITLPIKDVLK